MKKGLLSILTLALTVVNLALMLVLIFAVLPMANRTDSLITQIVSVLNLELENYGGENEESIPIDSMDTRAFETELTVNLVSEVDKNGRVIPHYAIFFLTVVLNETHEDYAQYSPQFEEAGMQTLLENKASDIITNKTWQEMEDKLAVQQEILLAFREMFKSNFIYDVQLAGLRMQ